MVNVGASKLLCQCSGGWLFLDLWTIASLGSLVRHSFDTIASYQEVPSDGVCYFEDDVSPSLQSAAVVQVAGDAPHLEHP